jgi:ATP-binding cassette subfamily B (MDR/TAP) protein 1
MFIGFICACIAGLGLPSFVFLFGELADSFVLMDEPEKPLERIKVVAFRLSLIGLGIWGLCSVWFTLLLYTSEVVAIKTKAKYLSAILNQESAWFDTIKPAELSATLSKECLTIQ